MTKAVLLVLFILISCSTDAQIIAAFAGGSTCGHSGDGGTAISANLDYPCGGTFDKSGNFYFAERLSNTVRKISILGIISTIAGNGTAGFSGDGGEATNAELNNPTWVSIDNIGNLYIADVNNSRIRKIDTDDVINTIAGNGVSAYSGDGGPSTDASLFVPECVCVDDSGNIYDIETVRIRKINRYGVINTVVGNGISGFSGDGGPASASEINPISAFIDVSNDIYIADGGNNRIRKVSARTGIINTIAGNGTAGFGGDGGPATNAIMNPFCVALDAYGTLFIADGSARVRTINTEGYITTFAGTGTMGYSGDGDAATTAQIYNPEGIAFDSCGNVYITDCANCRIRKVTFPYCGYLNVSDIANNGIEVSLHPNPVYDIINIDNIKTQSTYQLMNIIGTIVQQGTLKEGDNSVSIMGVASGMYVLEVMDNEQQKRIFKIIKQ